MYKDLNIQLFLPETLFYLFIYLNFLLKSIMVPKCSFFLIAWAGVV